MKVKRPDSIAHPLLTALMTANQNVAANAWNAWREQNDLDLIANSELAIIPMIYQKWKDDPAFQFDERITGIARKSFYQNTIFQQATEAVIDSLSHKQIPFKVIHDALINQTILRETMTARSAQSIDLWIPEEIGEALKVLTSIGWKYDRHFRMRAAFFNDHGLRLHVCHKLSRHWGVNQHARFYHDLGEGKAPVVNSLIDLLLLKFPDGKPIDLQSAVDFFLLTKLLKEDQQEELLVQCRYYLLSDRLKMTLHEMPENIDLNEVLQRLDKTIYPGQPTSADQLEILHHLFDNWIAKRTLRSKYAYHQFRYHALKGSDPEFVWSFYRYWHMQRHENKNMRAWVNTLRSTLRLK